MTEEERKRIIGQKLNEGHSLADVQRVLDEEYGEKITFLDLRMLAAELEVDWDHIDEEQGKGQEVIQDVSKAPTGESEAGGTQVSISKVVRPGAVLSGDVVFKSGVRAEWYVDSSGRLGLNPQGEGQPTEEDIQDFQEELQRQVSEQGMGQGGL
ncbi:MAG: hypothetical protein ACOCWJ_04955 [Verrucomicrobiota bacterium]